MQQINKKYETRDKDKEGCCLTLKKTTDVKMYFLQKQMLFLRLAGNSKLRVRVSLRLL